MNIRNLTFTLRLLLSLCLLLGTESCDRNPLDPGCDDRSKEQTPSRPILVGPDGTSHTDPPSFTLDLDQDGLQDVEFRFNAIATTDIPSSAGSDFYEIIPLGSHQLPSPTNEGICFAVDHGTLIDESTDPDRTWAPYPLTICSSSWTRSEGRKPWASCMKNNESRYVGIRMETDSGVRFGWIELRIDCADTPAILRVVDYRVAAAVGTGIHAGQ